MAPIFASPDIAALVAAFAPASPTKERSSLVRSSSGNNLLDSRHVLKQFWGLLETSASRIRLVDLPARLGISGKIEWLLACYEGPVYYGREGQALLPEPEIDRIAKDVLDRSQDAVIDATFYASGKDISDRTLRDLLSQDRYNSIHWWQDPGNQTKQYLYSDEFASTVGGYIRSFVPAEGTEGKDLSQQFPSAPPQLLIGLAKDARTDVPPAGKWEVLNGRIVFVPEKHGADLAAKKQEARRAEIQRCTDELRTHGFTRIRDSAASPPDDANEDQHRSMVEQVKERYAGDVSNGGDPAELMAALVEIPLMDKDARLASILTSQRQLDQALETLRLTAPQETARIWHARKGNESPPNLRSLTLRSLHSELPAELPRVLLQSSYLSTVDSIVDSKIAELHTQDHSQFHNLLNERLLAPLALYAAGMATIREDTLKEHLEEFLGQHFRREIIPSLSATLQDERLLLDRSRRKDYEKFHQSSADAKYFSDISTAVTKLARKQRLPFPPDNTTLQTLKLSTLRNTLKVMRKFPRASDVLQNLVWILLACATDGLYMSAGRDTTRMIRQHQAIAKDVVIVTRLETWRDEVKAGNTDAEMVKEMRQLAEEAVGGLGGA